MHAVNPVQRLRLLRDRLARQTAETADPEWIFHAEMSEIFHSVRDLHTNYLLPEPFSGKIAYLPFLVEEYQDEGGNFYVVSHIMQGFSAPGFDRGAEITHWSGIPIQRAVDLNAARFAGSNLAARHSRGVQSLTIRPLRIHLPPNEEWVTLSYVGTDGTSRELREPWRVVDNLPPLADADAVSPQAAATGVDLGADEASRAQRLLFAPQTVAQELALQATGELPSPAAGDAVLPTTMPQVFRARSVTASSGTFGRGDHGQGALRPGEQRRVVIAGVVLDQPGQVRHDGAVRQDRLDTAQLRAHRPEPQDAQPAGVGRHRPADSCAVRLAIRIGRSRPGSASATCRRVTPAPAVTWDAS